MAQPEHDPPISPSANDVERTSDYLPASTQTHEQHTVDFQPTQPTATAPITLADYELLGELGRGGMGVVYQARHRRLKRMVALKMMLVGAQAGERERTRFRIEAEAVARMQHPNIVQIHEIGEHDGHLYCALEFVGGGSLASKLHGQPLAIRETVPLIEQLAKAVQFAHRRNVIHRDLKPANVLLDLDGTPKITDFGLARQTDQDSGATNDGAVMGTPSYMAPEQALGLTHEAGPAADVYALGAILYECLTGRPPFKGKTVVETLDQVRHQEPVPPTRRHALVPRDLETICLKCLRKEPEQRYSSAQELADDLERFRTHQPIIARRVGSGERLRLWWQRNPTLGWLGISFLLLFLAVSIGAIIAAVQFSILAGQRAQALSDVSQANSELARTNSELETEKNNVANALNERTTALGKAQRALAMSTQAEAQTAWNNRNPILARQRLQAIEPNARLWEWGYLQRCFHPTTILTNERTSFSHVAWSPDSQTLAVATAEGQVLLVDARLNTVKHRLNAHSDRLLGLSFAPDGSAIVSASRRDVRVWSLTGQALRQWSVEADAFTAFAASPEGDLVALGTPNGEIRLWNPRTGMEGKPLPNSVETPVQVLALAFDPTGRTLARSTSNDVIALVPVAGGPSVNLPPQHDILTLAFSPDGTRLAGGGGLKLLLWDVAKRMVQRELPLYASQPDGYRHVVTSIEFRGDGRRIVTSCGGYALTTFPGPGPDNSVRVWDADTGQLVHQFRSIHGPVQVVRYRPDGQQFAGATTDFDVANASGSVHLWDARSDGDHRLLCGMEARVNALAFNADGSRLVTVGGSQQLGPQQGEVVIWDMTTHQPALRKSHAVPLNRVALAPTNNTVAMATTKGDLVLWDAVTGQTQTTIAQAHTEFVTSLNYLADGRLVSTGDDGWVRVWNTATNQRLAELKRRTVLRESVPIAVSHPTNAAIVVGTTLFNGDGEEEIVVWQPDQGSTPTLFARVKGGSAALAISSDGQWLASINNIGELTVWEYTTQQRRLQFNAHQAGGTSLSFSRDGRRLASQGRDRSIRLWDVETGRETLRIDGPMFTDDTLRFSPDGKRLVAGGGGAFDLLPFGGEVYSWETHSAPPRSFTHDPRWHNLQLLQAGGGSEATCFHGRYAIQGSLPSSVVGAITAGYLHLLDQWATNNDPRRPRLQREWAMIFDQLAPRYPEDTATRSLLVSRTLAPRWQTKAPLAAQAEQGTKLTINDDHNIRASGPNPDHNVYTLTFAAEQPTTGLQLTLNIDPESLRLGRAENGNFELSEIELYAVGADPQKPIRVPIRRAWGSYNAQAKEHYSKQDMRPDFAIDGDPKTVWNTWPAVATPQQLAVEFEPPATLPKQWQVRLRFQGPHARHALYNVRVSWTSHSQPLQRLDWQEELNKRPVSWWTIQAVAAYLDNDPKHVLTILANAKPHGEPPLDLALTAWALRRTQASTAPEARTRALNAAKQSPNDRLLSTILAQP